MNNRRMISWALRGAAAVVACILLGGCTKDKILVKVNKDGTGKIVVTKVFTKEAVETLRSQRHSMMRYSGEGEDEETLARMKASDPFFNEKALKMQAGRFGPMVTLAKARKFESNGARGYVAVYAFKNVNDVFIDLEQLSEAGMSGLYGGSYDMSDADEQDDDMDAPVAEKGNGAFEFRFTPGATAKLQILIPSPDDTAADDTDNEPADTEDEDDEEDDMMPDEAMMMEGDMPVSYVGVGNEEEAARRMLKGMSFDLSVEVEGTEVKTTAAHADPKSKRHITLLALDADKMMDAPAAGRIMKRISRYEMRNPLEIVAAAGALPGASVETNREITVEFK